MSDLKSIIEEYWKLILLTLVGSGIGLTIYVSTLGETKDAPETDPYEELLSEVNGEAVQVDEALPPEEESTKPLVIMADIKGAVINPGVYKMEAEDRIIDLVDKAGGLLTDADSNVVNFAQKVEDQMVVYIPRVGEENIEIPEKPTTENREEEAGKININEADESMLMGLSGIGPSKAASIIQYREEKGFFKSIDDIKNASGIGEATFNNLKDSITISQ